MEIINIKTEKLKLAEYNPRLDLQPEDKEYQDIRRSMLEFGLVEPLVVNTDFTLIAGHQRLKILKERGWSLIPCIMVDLDKQKEKILNIALNKISGDWDRGRLKDILEELDTGELDIDLTGFGEEEIENLMTEFHVEDIEKEENIKEYKRVHILISVDVDYYDEINQELEAIKQKIIGKGEYEQSAN